MKKPLLKSLLGSILDFGAFFGMCYLLAKHPFPSVLQASVIATMLFFVGAFALTTIIVQSSIAAPFCYLASRIPIIGKGLYDEDDAGNGSGLLSCPLCTGMWVGALMAYFGFTVYPILGVRDIVLHGLLASGGSYLLHKVDAKLN